MACRMRGFSIIELILVCALVAVLAGLAAPGFRDYLLNARRTGQVNELLHALHASRSAAIRRGLPVVLCKSADRRQCTPGAGGWDAGWIAFVNRDADSPPVVDDDEPILMRHQGFDSPTIDGNRDALTYWPFSLGGTTASFVFCDSRGSGAARAIIVSQTGRPRVSDRNASGQPLQCGGR